MDWSQFAAVAPEIARFAKERISRTGLLMLGTLRADGWPRISPIEPIILQGLLIVGGTHGTRKTLDLMRDPRCSLNTIVTDKDGTEGEVKLFGRALEITNAETIDRMAEDTFKRYGFRPAPHTYHNFSFDITSAAQIVFRGDLTGTIRTWREGEPVSEQSRRWTPDGYKIIRPAE